MGFSISVAAAADVQLMVGWAADEGWNPGNTDGLAYLATDPCGFLVGRLDGEPVTCISVVEYGRDFAFLGFYIARPDVRGQGYGLRTWQAGMARLSGRTVGLDGVLAQQPNYRRSGFRSAWRTVRFEGPPPVGPAPDGVEVIDARDVPFDRLEAYDRRHFGAPRPNFVAAWISLPERSAAVALRDGEIVGFAVLRAARSASRIGPLFAESAEVAAALVSQLARSSGSTTVAVDAPDINARAVAWLTASGLRPSFETARMYTAEPPEFDRDGVFGVASLELG